VIRNTQAHDTHTQTHTRTPTHTQTHTHTQASPYVGSAWN